MALPRSSGGKTETIIAVPTDWPIELPAAITTRARMSTPKPGASAASTAPPPNSSRPPRCTRRQPTMSARRPIGIISALMVSAWATTTQATARSVTP